MTDQHDQAPGLPPASVEPTEPTPIPAAPTPPAWSTQTPPAGPGPSYAGPPPGPQPAPVPPTWTSSGWVPPAPDATTSYSPAPQPTTDWERTARDAAPSPMPGAWFEQAPVPIATSPGRAGGLAGATLGVVLAASLSAAVLASGGTYLALSASGALDRSAATQVVGAGQTTAATKESGRFDESSAIIDAAAKAGPAVVQITTTAGIDPNNLGVLPETGIGSGIIFDSNGWILTNHHAVAGSDKLTVALEDGRTFGGTVYGVDTLTDLAVVKIDAKGLPTATLGDSGALKVGQMVIAIGSPLGIYPNSVTSGIVSWTNRSIGVDGGTLNNLIQTDTAINPGNSGGPLLDAAGNVIGINTAVAANAQGIGFAIPINLAKPLLQQALAGEKLARPWIGIRYQAITPALVQSDKLPIDHGALVGSGQDAQGQVQPGVVSGSPAEQAGIKDGDVVTSIEGQSIDTEHPLDSVITQFAPGRTVTVEVYRNGATAKLQVTLGTRPANL